VWLSGGTIRWRTIQLVLNAGYVDAYRVLHGGDAGYSFPTWAPHVRLDYLFTPSDFASRVRACEVFNHPAAPAASDHLPLVADVEVD
jgi:exodeoxyribonuclease-3